MDLTKPFADDSSEVTASKDAAPSASKFVDLSSTAAAGSDVDPAASPTGAPNDSSSSPTRRRAPRRPAPRTQQTPLARAFARLHTHGPVRSDDSWIAGVCAGLAAKVGCAPGVIRLAFVLLALTSFPAFIAYGVLWLLMPRKDGRIDLEEVLAGRGESLGAWFVLFMLVLQVTQ
jgi:phage shock protein PspC (stress-responsive transcriptional regulator)